MPSLIQRHERDRRSQSHHLGESSRDGERGVAARALSRARVDVETVVASDVARAIALTSRPRPRIVVSRARTTPTMSLDRVARKSPRARASREATTPWRARE